jgi:hypothetical protein
MVNIARRSSEENIVSSRTCGILCICFVQGAFLFVYTANPNTFSLGYALVPTELTLSSIGIYGITKCSLFLRRKKKELDDSHRITDESIETV